ncbi:MAG: hypothetical protein U0736_04205 [Gemmataceae bacterium]
MLVGRGGQLLGRQIEDAARAEAGQAVAALRRMGLRTVLLTGMPPSLRRSAVSWG